jgi:hypothetical protein
MVLFLVTHFAQIMHNWVTAALMDTSFPGQNLTQEDKGKFIRILFSVKDKRKFKSLLNDFALVCSGAAAPDVFVSYEL